MIYFSILIKNSCAKKKLIICFSASNWFEWVGTKIGHTHFNCVFLFRSLTKCPKKSVSTLKQVFERYNEKKNDEKSEKKELEVLTWWPIASLEASAWVA